MSTKSRFNGIINREIETSLKAKMIELNDGNGQGVLLRLGGFIFTVSEARAVAFADKIIDAVETGVKPPLVAAPLYTTRSATPAENK